MPRERFPEPMLSRYSMDSGVRLTDLLSLRVAGLSRRCITSLIRMDGLVDGLGDRCDGIRSNDLDLLPWLPRRGEDADHLRMFQHERNDLLEVIEAHSIP